MASRFKVHGTPPRLVQVAWFIISGHWQDSCVRQGMTDPRSAPRSRRRVIIIVVAVVIVSVCIPLVPSAAFGEAWETWVSSLPASLLIAALTLLPVIGFPITVLHIAVGARFGFGPGLGVIALATIVHLLGGFLLARSLEQPVRRMIHRLGWTVPAVPADATGPFTLWIALLPGISYGVKNVIPPIAGVGLRPYLGIVYPLHVTHACLGLVLGRMTMHFTWPFAAGLIIYVVALFSLTGWLARRLRSRPGEPVAIRRNPRASGADRRPPEDDRM